MSTFADYGAAGLNDGADLESDVVVDHDAVAGIGRGGVRRGGADAGAFVDDAAAANGNAAVGGVESRARVDDGLGADVDGVVAGQEGGVGDDDR